jgi:hypothetical protein
MKTGIIPNEMSISNVINNKYSLSPRNYKIVSISSSQQALLKDFLNESEPFAKGEEPGSIAYVKKSTIKFLRNSCIDKYNYTHVSDKVIYLNPNYKYSNMVNNFDILMCKDANIGDACVFIEEVPTNIVISSGIVKLNFKEEKYKYYCLAFLKDNYFLEQLDSKTPRGATIRHSRDLFLECNLPKIGDEDEWVYSIVENLVKNISFSEIDCYDKIHNIYKLIETELNIPKSNYENPYIMDIMKENRIDAGIFSKDVHDFFEGVKNYKYKFCNLDDYGFRLKRGPNLQKRDLGRSIQTDRFIQGYNILIYPSDISDGGYILTSTYIGARRPVWFLENKNILFSAEGTVGKTFVICDDKMRFITNIHGIIIYPKDQNVDTNKSIYLGMFLNYMRHMGILDKLSVGGQGGSFAVSYWHSILIPNFSNDVINALTKMYHNPCALSPSIFDIEMIRNAGIFELNNFRIVCIGILKRLINDIKNNKLRKESCYKSIDLS